MGLVLALLFLALLPGRAHAATNAYVLHVAAYPVEDACNGTVVILNGDFVITPTTTPTPDGDMTVRSQIVSTNPRGVDQNGMSYKALDAEVSFVRSTTP